MKEDYNVLYLSREDELEDCLRVLVDALDTTDLTWEDPDFEREINDALENARQALDTPGESRPNFSDDEPTD